MWFAYAVKFTLNSTYWRITQVNQYRRRNQYVNWPLASLLITGMPIVSFGVMFFEQRRFCAGLAYWKSCLLTSNMHKMKFWSRLHPRPRCESLRRSPKTLSQMGRGHAFPTVSPSPYLSSTPLATLSRYLGSRFLRLLAPQFWHSTFLKFLPQPLVQICGRNQSSTVSNVCLY